MRCATGPRQGLGEITLYQRYRATWSSEAELKEKSRSLSRAAWALGLAALALSACSQEPSGSRVPAEKARPIIPFEVEIAQSGRTVQAVGTARARSAAVIRPETAGIVDEVLFRPGTFVEAGSALIALEADEEQLAVKLAQISVQEAEQLLARYRRIENTGAVSDSAIDEARTRLEAAKINLEQAQLRLAERTVRAPFSGHTGLTEIDPGARVTQDVTITALDDRSVLYVDFLVPEDAFGAIAMGATVEALPFSDNRAPRQATIVSVDSRVNPQSRAFTTRAAIDNSADDLRPGMSFEVRFTIPGRELPEVPEAAIVWGANGAYLWAIEQGRTKQVAVNIVSRGDGTVLVDGPLGQGSLIVAEGVQKVREGTLVTFPTPSNPSSSAIGTIN